jgi:hypothetical protein
MECMESMECMVNMECMVSMVSMASKPTPTLLHLCLSYSFTG